MNKQNYALEVLINGRPAKEYYKDGRAFIEGRENTQYTLKFRNNSWKRVLAVFSVDGIEVIEGKVASEFKGGYVIEAYSSIEIKGYRIDEESVAAFRFAKTHKSYSNQVGGASLEENPVTKEIETVYKKTTRNNGVIGVRVFEEDIEDHNYAYGVLPFRGNSTFAGYSGYAIITTGSSPIYISGGGSTFNNVTYPVGTSSFVCATGCYAALTNINSTNVGIFNDASGSISCQSVNTRTSVNQMGQLAYVSQTITSAPDFNLGTTWGEKVDDKVKEVNFKKSEKFVDLEIYYDSRESLASYGIDFEATKQYVKWPSAFETKKQFCKVPEGYNAR